MGRIRARCGNHPHRGPCGCGSALFPRACGREFRLDLRRPRHQLRSWPYRIEFLRERAELSRAPRLFGRSGPVREGVLSRDPLDGVPQLCRHIFQGHGKYPVLYQHASRPRCKFRRGVPLGPRSLYPRMFEQLRGLHLCERAISADIWTRGG